MADPSQAEPVIKKSVSELEKLNRQELLNYSIERGYTLDNVSHLTNQRIIQILLKPDMFSEPQDTVCYD